MVGSYRACGQHSVRNSGATTHDFQATSYRSDGPLSVRYRARCRSAPAADAKHDTKDAKKKKGDEKKDEKKAEEKKDEKK